jgi:DNA-binding MarR family transcriptional regulator
MNEALPPAPARLTDLLDRINRMTRGLQYAHGLNPAQWDALRFIARANKYSRTPGALAKFLGTTKGTASQTVNALEKKGLLASRVDPADKRVRHVVVTAEGEALLARDPLNCLDLAVRNLPPDIAETITGGLGHLAQQLQSRCGGSDVGVCFQCGHLAGPTVDGGARCALKNADVPCDEARKLCINFEPDSRSDCA